MLKRFQLGLIHSAVAMTLVPINSTLNRVMIYDLGISATLVTVLAVFPYLLSPIQVAIGSFSDRHPVFGFRRTPYILAGLLLCVTGVALSPHIALLIHSNFAAGVLAGLFGFGAWGMGYNLSAVAYLSLASELSGEKERGKTIATMFFMMILALIATGVALGIMVPTFTPAALIAAINAVAGVALVLGLLGLVGLEPRAAALPVHKAETYSIREMTRDITANPVARIFFVYLLLLLAAILGQDVLLEPFGAEAFGMSVEATSRIVSISGTFTLLAFVVAAGLERRLPKRTVAQAGNLGALAGFLVIFASGLLGSLAAFYTGIILLGFGIGISTVANLSLMLDLTVPEKVGLYIGAWGFSNGLSRLTGLLLAGILADAFTRLTGRPLTGYLVVFGVEALMLLAAAAMLARIDVAAFRRRAQETPFTEKIAIAAES